MPETTGLHPELSRERLLAMEAARGAAFDPETSLLRKNGPGHSPETRGLPFVHDGRASAEWLALRAFLHGPQAGDEPILAALERMQETNPQSRTFGCSRWWLEESEPWDTNAAFFIGVQLVLYWHITAETCPESIRELLLRYFRRAAAWFRHECENPKFFYTNKTLSDAALALALADLLGDEALRASGQRFLERWCTYTEVRGWGWGENQSYTYCQVILSALWLLLTHLRPSALRTRLQAIEARLVDNIAFHAPCQFVPGIRTYNATGNPLPPAGLYSVLNLAEPSSKDIPCWQSAFLRRLAGLPDAPAPASLLPVLPVLPAFREEPVMDDVVAWTYRGTAGRLGAVSRFPVIPYCGHGLGWQSQPVSFLIEGEGMGYLQWELRLPDGSMRHHPALANGYNRPKLVERRVQPELITLARQEQHRLLVLRTVLGFYHESEGMSDQWRMPAFTGECHQETGGEPWTLLIWPGATVAIRALQKIGSGHEEPQPGQIEVRREKNDLVLSQELHPAGMIDEEIMQAGWVVLFLDGCPNREEALRRLAGAAIGEEWHDDRLIHREPGLRERRVTATFGDESLSLHCDPFRIPRMIQ